LSPASSVLSVERMQQLLRSQHAVCAVGAGRPLSLGVCSMGRAWVQPCVYLQLCIISMGCVSLYACEEVRGRTEEGRHFVGGAGAGLAGVSA
jgi:hypothetical protein